LNINLPLKGLVWLRIKKLEIVVPFIPKTLAADKIEVYLVTVFNFKSVTSILIELK
jgi:hypothetical protein